MKELKLITVEEFEMNGKQYRICETNHENHEGFLILNDKDKLVGSGFGAEWQENDFDPDMWNERDRKDFQNRYGISDDWIEEDWDEDISQSTDWDIRYGQDYIPTMYVYCENVVTEEEFDDFLINNATFLKNNTEYFGFIEDELSIILFEGSLGGYNEKYERDIKEYFKNR